MFGVIMKAEPPGFRQSCMATRKRAGDETFEGLFGINQHHGFDLKKSDIGRASAGCLVGRTKSGHAAFMRLCKEDPRYLSNNSYRFMTAVLASTDVPGA